ncbi:MAG: PAS domain-containing protein [Flavipsychrobacter sp.]|nr:PAS domain-containing protein [Flavipsychrobacter sp.]
MKLLDSMSDFYLIVIDMQGNYTYVNKAFSERFGFITNNFIGKTCMEDVHPEDAPEVYRVVEDCMSAPGQFRSIIIRKPVKGGGYATTDWDFVALKNEAGVMEGVMCIGYEVSELLDQIELKNRTIERLQFIQSHEVRKPVANILGLIDIIDTTNLDANTKFAIQRIGESAEQLDQILHDLAGRKRCKGGDEQ